MRHARHTSALATCHCGFQFICDGNKLNLKVEIRSNDFFLGHPFNVASYALLLMMVAKLAEKTANELVISMIDCHLYTNHLTDNIAYEQLRREPFPAPTMKIKDRGQKSIDDFEYDDFILQGYESHPAIKAPIAV